MSIEMQINDVQAQELGITSTDGLVLEVGEAVLIAGPKGEQGEKGDTGETGADGKDGVTPEFSIGTVETLAPGTPASASVTGTAEKPILNLGIPRGATGTSGGSASFEIDETLKYDSEGKLGVNMATEVEDKTLPITAAAVNTTVGNIEVLLQTI